MEKVEYKAYAGIRRGSLDSRHDETTVGSRVMRTCCGRMLKFIRCVRNHRRIADEYSVGAAVNKFPTKYFRIELCVESLLFE